MPWWDNLVTPAASKAAFRKDISVQIQEAIHRFAMKVRAAALKKEEKENSKLNYAHEIQHLFRYHYKDDWVDQSFINRHDRLWIQTFNGLVKQGFIERKKTGNEYNYRWVAAYPEI